MTYNVFSGTLNPTHFTTAPSYNMALIITSIKSNKPSFPITPCIQRLVSLAYFLF